MRFLSRGRFYRHRRGTGVFYPDGSLEAVKKYKRIEGGKYIQDMAKSTEIKGFSFLSVNWKWAVEDIRDVHFETLSPNL